jgi:hypothetical protein
MVEIYYCKEKNIIVQEFTNEMGLKEIERLRFLHDKYFKSWKNATIIAIHGKDSFIVDKEWPSEIGKFGNDYSYMHDDLYVLGMQGIQKMLFRLFLTFSKKSSSYHIAEHKDVEKIFNINLKFPNKDFIQAV